MNKTDTIFCERCDNDGWVCEAHQDKPWYGTSPRADACHCGAPGFPCPLCNEDGCQKTGFVSIIATVNGKMH